MEGEAAIQMESLRGLLGVRRMDEGVVRTDERDK